MQLETKTCQIEADVWHWSEAGEGQPMILLPGFAASRKTLFRLGRQLAQQYRVLLVDPPGFDPKAPLKLERYKLSEQVRRLRLWVQHLGLAEPILGGNSAGGQLAALYGLQFPTETAALVLLAPQGAGDADFIPYTPKPNGPTSIREVEQELSKLYHRPPQLDQAVLESMLRKQQIQWEWLNQIRRVIQSEPEFWLNEKLTSLEVATLVIWGEQDRRIPPRMAQVWDRASDNVEVHRFEQCGHMPQIEQTQACFGLITRFLGQDSGAGKNG